MTGTQKDPFERLSQIAAPEPDPRKMTSVIAMSSRAFAQDRAQPAGTRGRPGRLTGWFAGTGWTIPASAAAAALLAVVSIPFLGQFDMPGSGRQVSAPSPEQAADSQPPASTSLSRAPAPAEETRLGAAPQGSQAQLEPPGDATVGIYHFDGIDIVVRSAPEEATLSLRDGDVERPIDRRIKQPSETVIVSDAFVHGDGASSAPLLLIRSGFEDGDQQWDAFIARDGGYVLSGAVSLAIHDAADREEVEARLARQP